MTGTAKAAEQRSHRTYADFTPQDTEPAEKNLKSSVYFVTSVVR